MKVILFSQDYLIYRKMFFKVFVVYIGYKYFFDGFELVRIKIKLFFKFFCIIDL